MKKIRSLQEEAAANEYLMSTSTPRQVRWEARAAMSVMRERSWTIDKVDAKKWILRHASIF